MHMSLEAPRVPARSAALSAAALAVPIVDGWTHGAGDSQYELLVWLLALVPAFILAYHRGWRGAAVALAAGMAAMSLAQVGLIAAGATFEHWSLLLGVLIVFITLTLGIGWLAELLHRQRARVEELALRDPLTGLANRRLLHMFLQREFAAAVRGRPLTVVLFDIDDFKRYNDAHGHIAGDAAIRAFARALESSTREMNLSARFGGEEFLTLVSSCDTAGALVFVRYVRSALEAAQPEAGPITVSAGVASFDGSMNTADALIQAADRALYEAKRDGRNRTRVHDPGPAAGLPRAPGTVLAWASVAS
jgi:diguanylate cyclase (GGDEF)-like protein